MLTKDFAASVAVVGFFGFFFSHAPSVKANTFPDTTFLKRKPVLRLQSTQMRWSRSVPDFSYGEWKSLGQEAQACACSLSLTVCLSHTAPERPAVHRKHGGQTSWPHTPQEFLRNGPLTSDCEISSSRTLQRQVPGK